MDYSMKGKNSKSATRPTDSSEIRSNNRQSSETDAASSPLRSDQQETGSYPCPACPTVVTTSRDLTNHLRGHNSPRSTDYSGEEDYACGVCHKVLSSASSLDRHVLVHSGERPFKCKYCDMAFTTNGNMNRHLRTAHGQGSSPRENNGYTDSEGSSDSDKSSLCRRERMTFEEEFNNNEIRKRRSPETVIDTRSRSPVKRRRIDLAEELDSPGRRSRTMLGSSRRGEIENGELSSDLGSHTYSCPLCDRADIPTLVLLEAHIEEQHPECQSDCDRCHRSFNKADRSSAFQKYTEKPQIEREDRKIKFPAIARAICEKLVHQPVSGDIEYQCDKCVRAFPCSMSLEEHEVDCGTTNQQRSPTNFHADEQSSRRDNFFARLELLNTAAVNEAKEGKDLADIQSIISNTSGPPMIQNFPRSDASTPEHHRDARTNPHGSSASSGTPSSSDYHQEEEAQDAFAMEFRRMKLKGEFPCRLCDAIFPNLRALKGHNRSHMGVGPGVPYPCNMCPYTSNDKATLVKHLRSHNGDRPFECSLCHFAFTTKANCERHVRNRHGKACREEIKSVIIYHPSEDSTNDSGSLDRTPESKREEARKSLIYPGGDKDETLQRRRDFYVGAQYGASTTSGLGMSVDENSRASLQALQYEKSDFSKGRGDVYPSSREEEEADDEDYDEYDYDYEDNDYKSESKPGARFSEDDGMISLVSNTKMAAHQRAQASPIDLKKSTTTTRAATSGNVSEAGEGCSEDVPLDLSMDVLDLSKKSSKSANGEANSHSSSPSAIPSQDEFNRKQKELYEATNQFLLTQALLKAGQTGNPATSLEALYANAQMIYQNFGGFSATGVGATMLQPYLFNPHIFAGQNFGMKDRRQKELVRGLQLTSGGNIVEPSTGNTGFTGAYPPGREGLAIPRSEQPTDYGKPGTSKLAAPPKMVTSTSMRDPKIDPNSQSSNSVKMVIKNGVLMPKQKQRRYRTERPFSCEHCTAKFTLRSNMERHVKQQHPQHWSQRPRGGHSTRGRPPANPPSLLPANNRSTSSPQACPSIVPKTSSSSGSMTYEKHSISDQVKYAILAQQLKGSTASKIDDCDTEEELIIDEAANENREHNRENESPRATSLLRGKLEGTNIPYSREKAHHEAKQEEGKGDSVEKIPKIRVKVEPMEEEQEQEMEKQDKEEEDEEEEKKEEEDIAPRRVEESHETCDANAVKVEHQQERNEDLASVSELLDNASQQYQQFQPQYMSDEEGLVASTSDCNNSGSDEKSDSINSGNSGNSQTSSKLKKKKKMKKKKKKSAYSMAPNRVICPYCERPFPWTSSLRRHILTHTGQKPYQCVHCSLLFTTKSNCDRHLLRKHKNSVDKIHHMRNSSSPEPVDRSLNNEKNTSNNLSGNNAASNAFAMRNVPERPYKCNLCPSSTFATLGNLKKHKSSKHSRNGGTKSRAESPSISEPRNSPITTKQDNNSDYESQSSSISENTDNRVEVRNDPSTSAIAEQDNQAVAESNAECLDVPGNSDASENAHSQETMAPLTAASNVRRVSPRSSPGPTDGPFKCHLCDSGFSDRQDCLEHIRINHTESYEILADKGALDMDFEAPEDQQGPPSSQTHDYSNRKVVCAFCMRRFWSAEDLRRHMRTHTGERPFWCDICTRRFTLKHSMLRHRKKHESVHSIMYVGTSGDEESAPSQPRTITPRSQKSQNSMLVSTSCDSRIQERMSLPTVATVATGDAAPSGLMRLNPYEKLTTLTGKIPTAQASFDCPAGGDSENDLISNLLGIRDKSIIDKVLQASADDAAKLLGVNGHHD